MRRQDIEKLIGGYGAGILTPEEEQALFAAALEDQTLFDALAGEQPLRDLLQDPAARTSLLAALADRPVQWHRRMAAWLMRPRTLAAVAAVLCLAVTVSVWTTRHRRMETVLTARVAPTAPVPVALPEAAAEPAAPPRAQRAEAAAKRKAEVLEMETPPLANAPSAGSGPTSPGNTVARAGGVVGGVPQTVGQLTPAVQRPQASDQIASAPPPPAPKALPVPAPEISPLGWTVLRRQPDGEFVQVDAGSLQTGDAVKLRLESKDAGYVYVVEKQKVLAWSRLEPDTPFDAAIEPQGSGRRDLQLWFSTYPMAWATTGSARLEMSRMTAGTQAVSGVEAPRALKVPAAGGSAPVGPVSIPITLNYQ